MPAAAGHPRHQLKPVVMELSGPIPVARPQAAPSSIKCRQGVSTI